MFGMCVCGDVRGFVCLGVRSGGGGQPVANCNSLL